MYYEIVRDDNMWIVYDENHEERARFYYYFDAEEYTIYGQKND